MPIEPQIPFIWPDPRVIEGLQPYSSPVLFDSFIPDINNIFGIVSSLDKHGVGWLEWVINENKALKLKLILALYGACDTKEEDLQRLLELQSRFSGRIDFRLLTTDFSFSAGSPTNALCFYATEEQTSFMAIGPTGNFGLTEPLEAQVNFVFKGDASLVDAWRKWFEYTWLTAAPLCEASIVIPPLVPAKGTEEAEAIWLEYLAQCEKAREVVQSEVTITVDEETGEVTAVNEAGETIEPPTISLELPRLDQVADRISRLYAQGSMVTIDKSSRIPPLDAPIKAEWFGVASFRQIGAVSRQVNYRISVIDEQVLKKLEDRRKSIRQIINTFSFPLADGVCWMPNSAKELFELELHRVNEEGKALLNGSIGSDINAFVDSQTTRIIDDANKMYKDFNPNGSLSSQVIGEIVTDLKDRLNKALDGKFLPQISFVDISFSPKKESESVSAWGQALSILEAVAHLPRELSTNQYMTRGVKVDLDKYAKAMDVLEDAVYKMRMSKGLMSDQLEFIKYVMKEQFSQKQKCGILLNIVCKGLSYEQLEVIHDIKQQSFTPEQTGELFADVTGGKSHRELHDRIAKFVTDPLKNKQGEMGFGEAL